MPLYLWSQNCWSWGSNLFEFPPTPHIYFFGTTTSPQANSYSERTDQSYSEGINSIQDMDIADTFLKKIKKVE